MTETIKCPCGCGNRLYITKSEYFDKAIVIGIGDDKGKIESGFLVDKKVLKKINDLFKKLSTVSNDGRKR